MRFRSLFVTALAAAASLNALAQTPITLDQAMANPDWIGPPVESAWWSWDGKGVLYQLKRAGSPLRDTYAQSITGGAAVRVDDAALAGIDGNSPVFDAGHTRMLFVRHGDVFERDLRSGALTQITRTTASEASPQYSADGRSVQFRVGNDWLAWNAAARLVSPIALPVADKDPTAAPKADSMREMQLRLIATLNRQKLDREAQRAQAEAQRRSDPTQSAAPVYLGEGLKIDATALSPNGRWLLVVTSAKDADVGRIGKLPLYVTESGYEEFEEQRVRVGRNSPIAQNLKLVDLVGGSARDLSYDSLPGIATDPLADLRKAQKLDPLKGNRPVRVISEGDNVGAATIRWSADGERLAVQIRAIDNKDRWIASVDLAAAKLQPAHRLTDPAWINWSFNDYGWLPDNRTLWYLSEETGYSHLYVVAPGGK
ncbi:MAG: DPP IV N-terminal domain-containing protein, partial [Arenimonas sp.]|nr:DPP IV N-terminal domain-containing protein [Arenimonas sp.]